jgi:LmbE family N-acetylglucosaminyl deacetylase
MKYRFLLLIALLFHLNTQAQTAPPQNLIAIKQGLEKLPVLGSVLYIAAHPDDENTRLLAYLAQEKHYRTGYLALTRGDGGQNLIGNEQGELLGLIRTQELLAARRVDGAEQFFTRANDFGFSKGPDETLKIWDRDKILSDVVWVIRKFRPDVMICRFPTTGEGGHGHHTASAILAQEAFTAAADPKRFPEQLKYVQPWQAKRLLWNTFSFGGNNTTAPNQLKIDVGVYNQLIGKGYGEVAAESRSNHKTQGFGTAAQRGQAYEYFKTILGDAPQTELMDGINTSWSRVKDGAAIAASIEVISKGFDDAHPERSVPALVQLLGRIKQITDNYWRTQKTKELSELIAACSGLWAEGYVTEPTYAVGDQMNVSLQMIERTVRGISLQGYHTNPDQQTATQSLALPFNQVTSVAMKIKAEKISQPYWLESPHPIGTYTINDETKVGNPENPDAPAVTLDFMIEGRTVSLTRKLMYKYVDPARGEIYQPVEITPPVTANVANKVYIFSKQQPNPQTVQVKLESFTNGSGSVCLQPLAGWKISPAKIDFTNKKKGDEWTANFTLSPADANPKTSTLTAVATINGQSSSMGILRIQYDHVPHITLFPPSQTKLVEIDLNLKGNKKIGYIAGAGDQMPDELKQIGYDVHMLTENEVMNTDLSGYDAIVTGVRAYNVNERLVVEQPRLLDYVKNGGNLVVQYNNNNGILVPPGPYPFRPVNERVTDEFAKVTFLQPESPVLNYPNKITPSDFDGWVQERGLYFVSNIDPKYQTPLQMNDAGEAPNKGSLIVTDYGKGRFVYTSLAFFRQLPAGVPGAFRLFVNLLSKP